MDEDGTENKTNRTKNKMVQASLKNVQKQRELALELQEIDRQMEIELKILTREKLDVLKDMVRLEEEKRTVDYLNDDINGKSLKQYNQKRRNKDEVSRDEKQNKERYDFKLNANKIYVKLPPLEIPELLKENKPPVPPPKPRLYRSNSLIRQRSASVNSIVNPNQFSSSLRESKTTTHYMSLPDIHRFDKTNRKIFPRKNMPDIEENSEIIPPVKVSRFSTEQLPHLGQRSRTIV